MSITESRRDSGCFFGGVVSTEVMILVANTALGNESTRIDCDAVGQSTSAFPYPAFCRTVSHVIGLRTRPEMSGLAASRVVAARTVVEDVGPIFGDCVSSENDPCNSVGERHSPLPGSATCSEDTVALVLSGSGPQQTARSFVSLEVAAKSHEILLGQLDRFGFYHPTIVAQCGGLVKDGGFPCSRS
jgi:hypothetical protein